MVNVTYCTSIKSSHNEQFHIIFEGRIEKIIDTKNDKAFSPGRISVRNLLQNQRPQTLGTIL